MAVFCNDVSLRTAWKALSWSNEHEARSPLRWPCILVSTWPWNFKAVWTCKNTANAKTLWDWTSRSRVSRILSADSTSIFPGRLNQLRWLESTLTTDSTSEKFDQLDRFRGLCDRLNLRKKQVCLRSLCIWNQS